VRRVRDSDGQASVELVALLPVLALVVALLWQGIVAGQALWLSGSAARAAARADALGEDAEAAARRSLPRALAAGVSVESTGENAVTVRVRVPAIIGGGSLGGVSATAAMARQR
jgi:hypothetical protein